MQKKTEEEVPAANVGVSERLQMVIIVEFERGGFWGCYREMSLRAFESKGFLAVKSALSRYGFHSASNRRKFTDIPRAVRARLLNQLDWVFVERRSRVFKLIPMNKFNQRGGMGGGLDSICVRTGCTGQEFAKAVMRASERCITFGR